MPRLVRVVVPGLPHHVTQRGNRRQRTFFAHADYQAYIDLMREWCGHWDVAVWAYCLMPNHVHLIVVPPTEDALRRAVGEAHRRYTRRVNFREAWGGHLWLGARYVELNPVRAGLAQSPAAYRWSSARAHLSGRDHGLVRVAPLVQRFGDWAKYLAQGLTDAQASLFRKHKRTGRPMGSEGFVAHIEKLLGRVLRGRRPGPKGPRNACKVGN